MLPQVTKQLVVLDDPSQPEVHCSSIAVGQRGQRYVTWFGGTKEGHSDVKIWFVSCHPALCMDRNVHSTVCLAEIRFSRTTPSDPATWTSPVIIASRPGIVHWNPVTFLPSPSLPHLVVFYKTDTPIPRWRTHFIESHDGGETWSEPRELVEGDESGGRGPSKNPVVVMSNGEWIAGGSVEVTLPGGKGKWVSGSPPTRA